MSTRKLPVTVILEKKETEGLIITIVNADALMMSEKFHWSNLVKYDSIILDFVLSIMTEPYISLFVPTYILILIKW